MLVDDLNEPAERLNLPLELLAELLLLLIAPGALEHGELSAQRLDPLLNVGTELFEALGEAPQFLGIDDGLRHFSG